MRKILIFSVFVLIAVAFTLMVFAQVQTGPDKTKFMDRRFSKIPVECPMEIISAYGDLRCGVFHPGHDIAGNCGDPVLAPEGGVFSVESSGDRPYVGYGNVLVIKHPPILKSNTPDANGNYDCVVIKTLYAHLSGFIVGEGEVVSAGQQIAKIGDTGPDVTGCHLHFETRRIEAKCDSDGNIKDVITTPTDPQGIGNRVDPDIYLPTNPCP